MAWTTLAALEMYAGTFVFLISEIYGGGYYTSARDLDSRRLVSKQR